MMGLNVSGWLDEDRTGVAYLVPYDNRITR